MTRHLTITLTDTPTPGDLRVVRDGLNAFNRQHVPEDNYRPLALFLRSEDQTIVGGLLGATYWGWLYIEILWFDESVRRQGYGEKLLALAEQEAIKRGCRYAHLDTMSFQALPFYEQHGYSVYGTLHDIPAGSGCSRYFARKELPSAATEQF